MLSVNVYGSYTQQYTDSHNKSIYIANAMEQSPSWEANTYSASQEISCILWNPKIHNRNYKRPSPAPVLGQINPVHTTQTTSWIPISILSSHQRPGLPSDLLRSGLLTKTLYSPFLSPMLATCPFQIILLDFITRIMFGEE